MYLEVISSGQTELVSLVSHFSSDFYLTGGSAIGLQIGHRRSFDFDFMTREEIHSTRIINEVERSTFRIEGTLTQSIDELSLVINGVRVTFLSYPYDIVSEIPVDDHILMPGLTQLGAMKAYALGRRSKWRDYVDLYFVFKYHTPFAETIHKARELFGNAYNEKLFREQLCYFDDIDFSESVQFMDDTESEEVIKSYLTDLAIS